MTVVWRMMAVVFLLTIGSAAIARDVAVRSGEHPGFSRLVVLFPPGTVWSVETRPDGAVLRAQGGPWRYLTEAVFQLIPRQRIVDVRQEGEDGLRVATAGQVHVQSINLGNGTAVLDVLDGADTVPPTPVGSGGLPAFYQRQPEVAAVPPPSGASSADASAFHPPDPRVAAAQEALLHLLGRASAQGMIRVDPRVQPNWPAAAVGGDRTDPGAGDAFGMSAETVVDRDLGLLDPGAPPVTNMRRCASDALFDPGAWLGDQPVDQQIAAARDHLVGEFDAPRSDRIVALGRLYVALGFSAEARDLFRAFGVEDEAMRSVTFMADVLDGAAVDPASPYLAMRSCPRKVALWAMLASPETAVPDADLGAVQSAFSALPPELRARLGPVLVARLVRLGARDRAEETRNSLRRSAQNAEAPIHLVEAEVDLMRGDRVAAEANLDAAAQGQPVVAVRALELKVDTRLAQGQAIARSDIDDAAGLEHVLGTSRNGYLMRSARLLGEASLGNFEIAFGLLAAWPVAAEPDLRGDAQRRLFELLTKVPDDTVFAAQLLGRTGLAQASNLSPETQIALSERLSGLGFGEAAVNVLTDPVRRSAAGRTALAAAAMAATDAPAALAYMEGLSGDRIDMLRAKALSALGRHADAAEILSRIGDKESAVREAWRGQDWARVLQHGSDQQRNALTMAGVAPGAAGPPNLPTDQAPAPPAGSLGAATALIRQSQSDRAAVGELLSSGTSP